MESLLLNTTDAFQSDNKQLKVRKGSRKSGLKARGHLWLHTKKLAF